MSEAAAVALTEPARPQRSRRERLRRRFAAGLHLWRSSLRFRVVAIIVCACLLVMTAIGATVLAAVRTQIYDRAVASCVSQFEGSYASAESTFASVASPTTGQVQQLANTVVAAQLDASHSVMGAALLRTTDQTDVGFRILEPVTSMTSDMRSLITQDLREAVAHSEKAHWQPIALAEIGSEADADNANDPGIMIGERIAVPGAGNYEFYIAYSMAGQANTIRIVLGLIALGFLALLVLLGIITYFVVRMVLQPVSEASAKASRLADGDYDVRMKVDGEDELAQLATSFNAMAASIEDQMERYERVSNVQQAFVSAISHELRSPVTTIRMAGQLIYDNRDALPNVLRRSAELQNEQLINLDTMLSDLLEISRYDAGAMTLATEEADIGAIVAKAVAAQQPLAEDNGVEVELDVEGETTARVEARRIERIVRNLVVNGLEHAEGRPLKIRVRANDTAVAVEVSDHGVGLTAEQAEHVFDRFWRADSSRVRKSGGTGLGLTISREDAELHGGRLECVGELGVGSTFLLTLPRSPGELIGEPPIALRVAAAEEDWSFDQGAQVDEGEQDERAEAAHDGEALTPSEETAVPEAEALGGEIQISDTQEIPRIRMKSGDESRELTVIVPSSGVAIIKAGDAPSIPDTQEEKQ